jgi:hypothetical protein
MISIDDVWKKILENEGEIFKTKKDISFKYTINEDKITPHPIDGPKRHYSDETMSFKKNHVEQAIDKIPIRGYNDLRDILEVPTWLYSILTDTRIVGGFCKKIRWNAKTREYDTLLLNDSNQTKEEYEEFRKDFFKEHDYYPED